MRCIYCEGECEKIDGLSYYCWPCDITIMMYAVKGRLHKVKEK